MSDLISYNGESAHLELLFREETFWLTQKQIAELFAVDRSVVTKHLRNIFAKDEVDEKSNVQKMHIAGSDKPVAFYSLDIVLSVGYRVNTKKGTQFRQWASRVLKEKILSTQQPTPHSLAEFEQILHLVQSTLQQKELSHEEAIGLLSVIVDYAQSWLLLQRYDEQRLSAPRADSTQESVYLDYLEAKNAIAELKKNLQKKGEASDLFGIERDGGLEAILGNIFQSVFGEDAYPSAEEKAAHLLYFIIKNHPFTDGNKRIGAFLFVLFLAKNGILENEIGEKRINDTGLVTLALLIAESDPKQKESLTRLVVNFLSPSA